MDYKKALPDPIGMHVILDLYECDPKILDNKEEIEKILTDSARLANAQIVSTHFRKFAPQGVTGVVVVAESHISIHTWPELGYAAVDVYTCGSHTLPLKASKYIIEKLGSKRPTITKIDRGFLVEKQDGVITMSQESPTMRDTAEKPSPTLINQ